MMQLEMADAFGIPEYFATTVGKIELAGGGCVRAYLCVEKSGILVPQYTVVMPGALMLAATKKVQDGARALLETGRLALVPSH